MGQYYITVNKTKKEYIDTYTFGDGAKFLEFMSSSRGMKEATMMLLTNGGRKDNYLGHWAGDSIEVLGDYAEDNLWDEVYSDNSKWKNISFEVYKALFEHNTWFAEEEQKYLREHGDQYLYSVQQKALNEIFPEAIMEGNLRVKFKKEYNIKETKVFTFDDLIFKPHRIGLGHVQAKHTFENGNSVSVVGGEMLNGNGVDTWEIGIIDEKDEVMETIDFADKDKINEVLQKQQNYGF